MILFILQVKPYCKEQATPSWYYLYCQVNPTARSRPRLVGTPSLPLYFSSSLVLPFLPPEARGEPRMGAGKLTGSCQAEVGPMIVQDVLFRARVTLRNVLDAYNLIPPGPFNVVMQLGNCQVFPFTSLDRLTCKAIMHHNLDYSKLRVCSLRTRKKHIQLNRAESNQITTNQIKSN